MILQDLSGVRRELGFDLAGLDRRGTRLDEADNMLDDVAIRQPVISKARNINLMGSPAATREADIGFPRPRRGR